MTLPTPPRGPRPPIIPGQQKNISNQQHKSKKQLNIELCHFFEQWYNDTLSMDVRMDMEVYCELLSLDNILEKNLTLYQKIIMYLTTQCEMYVIGL